MIPHKLPNTFAVIKPDLSIDPVTVSETLGQELDHNYAGLKGHTDGFQACVQTRPIYVGAPPRLGMQHENATFPHA